ncbi:alpha-1,3-arabinosyltransferase XAT3-like [Setaria viridis]|uniref:alpha-1,3-arabinosyltransferase XAT3-like n=1 Tax=Setaria viridis TaxID=4556 RepID=UPI0014938A02|nr:alpha-1,3-arabinosyltransferase XAT3-like [Setaria viridis]
MAMVTIRFLVVGIVVFFVAHPFAARLFTAGNKTAAAVGAGQSTEEERPEHPQARRRRTRFICRLVGDVRAVGATNTVLYLAPAGQKQQANATTTWRIKAQSGRYIRDSERVTFEARVVYPAVVFTVSRHLRNLRHSFADVLVPLFATARAFDRQVRCYPWAIVGLRGCGDLAVDDGNNTLLDFRAFLRSAFSLLPVPAPMVAAKPRLMLVDRHKTRSSGEGAAAEELSALARLADSCDVLVGAHGAGLTHLLFLRSGSVVVEVVPYGLAGAASTYRDFFERPARALRLRTLLERYGAAHPVISDPVGVYRRGEAEGKPYAFRHYWNEQDIRLNVTTRFGAVLARGVGTSSPIGDGSSWLDRVMRENCIEK